MGVKHIGNKIQMGGNRSEIRKIFHDALIMISINGTENGR
jgi:hypothetical protein